MAENKPEVQMLSGEEIADCIAARSHWIVIFGQGLLSAVYKLDEALDHWPSYTTMLIPPVAMTIIPKAEVSAERLDAALRQLEDETPDFPAIDDEHDLIALTDDPDEGALLMMALERVAAGL